MKNLIFSVVFAFFLVGCAQPTPQPHSEVTPVPTDQEMRITGKEGNIVRIKLRGQIDPSIYDSNGHLRP